MAVAALEPKKISLKQVAIEWGFNTEYLRRLAASGSLPGAVKVGKGRGAWRVDRETLEREWARRAPA